MGFITIPITVDEALKLIDSSDGEVVSASQEEYFSSISWYWQVAKAEIADDSITVFFTLQNGDFVKYCCVKSKNMTTCNFDRTRLEDMTT